MVSALWNACSEGNLERVQDLLQDVSAVDIEIKDPAGVTPLIEAVRNGHVDVVRALLDKGADPNNASSQGPPQQFTTDPVILEMLGYKSSNNSDNGPTPEVNGDSTQAYYGPTGMYPYFPTIASAPATVNGYYPPPPQPMGDNNEGFGGPGHLPPPEVARYIPCRYFPACRYGSSCMFLHPQGGYYQGPVPPPAQYPVSYDPMAQPYPTNYYAPPPFQPPNGLNSVPTPTISSSEHVRSLSEATSPQLQPNYLPNGVPPMIPYGPMSPSGYAPPGQVPVPMSIPPLPPLHNGILPHMNGQPIMYPQPHASPQVVPFPGTQPNVAMAPYATGPPPSAPAYADNVAKSPQLNPQPDVYPNHYQRDGLGHHRGNGNARRGSFAKKPPCLFFPSGRCKNGNVCRFPHILPNESNPPQQTYYSGRGGTPRSRGISGSNGFGTIDEKMAGLSIRDDQSSTTNRARFTGPKNVAVMNSTKRPPLTVKQRVPSADEFPVLPGAPPRSGNGLPNGTNGTTGPTVAQILQAPAPMRQDSAKDILAYSESVKTTSTAPSEVSVGILQEKPTHVQNIQINSLPVSFASIAAPDAAKEVSVTA